MPLAAVVVVPSCTQVPDGSTLPSVMGLPGRGVPLAVRVPERVKDWLTAGVVLLEVMVRAVEGGLEAVAVGVVDAGLEDVAGGVVALRLTAGGVALRLTAGGVLLVVMVRAGGVALRLTAGGVLLVVMVRAGGVAMETVTHGENEAL